jgi:hypothetical protein
MGSRCRRWLFTLRKSGIGAREDDDGGDKSTVVLLRNRLSSPLDRHGQTSPPMSYSYTTTRISTPSAVSVAPSLILLGPFG